jgi:hypothetical protein
LPISTAARGTVHQQRFTAAQTTAFDQGDVSRFVGDLKRGACGEIERPR